MANISLTRTGSKVIITSSALAFGNTRTIDASFLASEIAGPCVILYDMSGGIYKPILSIQESGADPLTINGSVYNSTAANINTKLATDLFFLGNSRVLLYSAPDLPNVTNSAVENTIFTGTLPANPVGTRGFLYMSMQHSYPNSAGTKRARIKIGGVTVVDITGSTTLRWKVGVDMHFRGSLSSQRVPTLSSAPGTARYGSDAVAVLTTAIDFTVPQTVLVTLINNTAGESATTFLDFFEMIGTYIP